jgi:hypothetical protein
MSLPKITVCVSFQWLLNHLTTLYGRPMETAFVLKVLALTTSHLEHELGRGGTTSLLEAISVSIATADLQNMSLDDISGHH